MQPNQPLRAYGANRRNQSASRIPASLPGYPIPDHRYQPYMHDVRSWQSGHPSGMPTNHQVYAMPVSEAIPSWDMITHDNSRVQPAQLTTYSPISPLDSRRFAPRSLSYGQTNASHGAISPPHENPFWSGPALVHATTSPSRYGEPSLPIHNPHSIITNQQNVSGGTSAIYPPTSSVYHSTPQTLTPSFSTPGTPPTIPVMIPTPASNRSNPETARRHKPTSKSIPCPDQGCQITFSRPQDVERHVKSIHCGERHACPGCTRSYTRLDALKRHQKEAGCGLNGN